MYDTILQKSTLIQHETWQNIQPVNFILVHQRCFQDHNIQFQFSVRAIDHCFYQIKSKIYCFWAQATAQTELPQFWWKLQMVAIFQWLGV